ncbi:MAG: FliM/FliN family flagellar motor C-terminal domain-containing protein, partial [Lentisphaeraceae bacterium]|nr:FliM/FliN family flagellar motor C-terminal domain-containing protein [Lentisphaeraceae bacterium]
SSGDLLVLDNKFNDLLPLYVGGMKYGNCKPGRVGKAVGVKIVKSSTPENNDILVELSKPE